LHWEMVHLKGAGRAVLRDYTVQVFERHVDYILGDECLLIGVANPTMACGPTWDLLMKYELEVRKFAIRRVNEGGSTLAEAMEAARRSIEHRTSFFITPLAMPNSRVASARPAADSQGPKRSAEEAGFQHDGSGAQPQGAKKKQGKAKGKGKDGAKGKTADLKDFKSLSPKAAYRAIRAAPDRFRAKLTGDDGVPRCHHFQMGSCARSDCRFAHVCMRCGGAHGILRCPELGMDKR